MKIDEFVEAVSDPSKPPTVWFIPYYGNGLETTGTGLGDDCGEKYGYCYLPQLHLPSFNMFTANGASTLGKYTGPERVQCPPKETHAEWLHHPYFATAAEAIAWIRDVQEQVKNFTDADRKFYNFPNKTITGDVQRYAHHKPLEQRVPTWDFDSFSREYRWRQYYPWVTAGVTDTIRDEGGQIVSTVLSYIQGFNAHNPDGTVVKVGGK